jgi:hypothetical protein
MPKSKKRRDKKKREPPPAAPAEPAGLLTRMRGGIRNVTGSGPKKPESLISKIFTWALVAAVAYFLARRFGILP